MDIQRRHAVAYLAQGLRRPKSLCLGRAPPLSLGEIFIEESARSLWRNGHRSCVNCQEEMVGA